MSDSPVQYEVIDNLGVIYIDNPPVNALGSAVRSGIRDALNIADKDDSKAVLIFCRGRTFFAGADISEFGKPPQEPSLPQVVEQLENFSKPVVAALHGTALGGGLEVALATHYRCAAPTTKLGLPEVNLGLLPGAGGTQRLPRVLGVEKALEMMISGKPIGAADALAGGLVDEIIESDLETGAIAYAQQLIARNASPRPTGARQASAPADPAFFDNVRKKNARKTRGQLAPEFITQLAELATTANIEEGQAKERELFKQCLTSPQSAAMRHVFFAQRATSKLPDLPADTPVREVNKVAVIGAGTMGGGIAMCFANAGIPVTLVETQQEFLDRGMATIEKNYTTSVKRGRFNQEQADKFLSCFSGTLDYADIADVDLVIEAVFENMAVKKEVFAKLDSACKPECILATNTSYLDVDEIASVTSDPSKVIGAHFFSPANVMKLLEVVRAGKTAPDVVQTFIKLAKTIGKIPVAVKVCHGFVGNRMLQPYLQQTQLLLLEGASPADIDSAMENWGMAMGPTAVGDLAGLDIGYRSRRDQGMEPHADKEYDVVDTLVEMERLGQKTGAGFYTYDPDTRRRQPDPEVDDIIAQAAEKWGVTRREISAEEIVDRLILGLVNEGAKILEEGIAARASDIDIVYLNGYGFPVFRGGPMFYAEQTGLDKVVARMNELKEQTGDARWEPAPLLVKLAKEGNTLKDYAPGQ